MKMLSTSRLDRLPRLLAIFFLAAAPFGIAAAFAADPPAPAPAPPAVRPGPPKPDPKGWKAADNWKVDVLAEHPAIHHPSVVYPAPDGRIFLAEDPMDMKGSSKEPADRILVIHPDGKITVFADKLYAVFGMQYIDGKLYVHHTPKFSVFTDKDSVGVDRVDLINSDNPAPNLNGTGFNDHVPSNCRLAMDGYLYITTGDKGIYNAESTVDHSKATIHGGGIMRMRPDGTDISVYVTGTRNFLDVAINSEDEMFTYDNTDDGVGWWTRFSHMVDGGTYGYPYDYRPPDSDREAFPAWSAKKQATERAQSEWDRVNRDKPASQQTNPRPASAFTTPYRPWTLWRMEEYGGGSPTGAVAYNEESLPAEFHGNIFAAEWGKQEIQRFIVQRSGGSYKVVSREVILKGGTLLRPVGIQVLPDGSGLLIADWNYTGWRNANTDAGRLLKLTYTGKLTPSPRPSWFVAASMGKPFEATTPELIAALSHPAQSVRLVAQRRIAERGGEAVAPLIALLKDTAAPNHAKWHAIWTLDAIDGGKPGRAAIIATLQDTQMDLSVRMQAARELGGRKATEATTALIAALNQTDEALRFRAATALGRIGNPAAVPPLLERLDDTDLFTHYAIFNALNRIGKANAAAWEPIVAALANDKTETREGAALAMHATYDESLVKQLAAFVANPAKPADARAATIAVIAPLQKQQKPWEPTSTDLKWWRTMPAREAAPPRNTPWAGTESVRLAIRAALEDPSSIVRQAAVQALRFAPDPTSNDALAKLFDVDKDAPNSKAVLLALAASKAPITVKYVDQILNDLPDQAKAELLFTPALSAAESVGGPEMAAVVLKFVAANHQPANIVSALETLSRLPDVKSLPVLVKRLSDPDPKVINAASNAIGAINDDQAVVAIAPLLKDKRGDVKRGAANAMGLIKRPSCVEPLLAVWRDTEIQKEAILALAARADLLALDPYLEGLASPDANVRNRCRRAIDVIQQKALPLIEARLDTNPPAMRVVVELQTIYEKYIPQGQRTGKLYRFDTKSLAPEAFLAYAQTHPGDPANGKKIFSDTNGAGCIKCHRLAGAGGEVGPALDGVGAKYGRDFLVDSILYPSKQILDGYQQTVIKRVSNGNIEQGLVRAETDADVTLIDSGGLKIIIPKSDIASRKISPLSLMPEGLQTAMKPEDFADVIAFLESLKEGAKEPGK